MGVPNPTCTNCGKNLSTDDLRGDNCRYCGTVLPHRARAVPYVPPMNASPYLGPISMPAQRSLASAGRSTRVGIAIFVAVVVGIVVALMGGGLVSATKLLLR